MKCPKCGSGNVVVQMVEKGQQTKRKGIGLGGHVNNTARGLTAICTLGMSNLVWKNPKGTTSPKRKRAPWRFAKIAATRGTPNKSIFG